MDFLYLSLVFALGGLSALVYYKLAPTKKYLKERLPNRISWAGFISWLIVIVIIWFIFNNYSGFTRTTYIFTLFFALLLFETFFLIIIKYIKSNLLASLTTFVLIGSIFSLYLYEPTFVFRNIIIILASLGAVTLLIRLGYLKVWIIFALAIIWTGYDIWATQYFFPNVLVPVTEASRVFFFPAAIVGQVSLGSGDFIFLSLFTIIILHRFGVLPAVILVTAQSTALIITALLITSNDFIIPFLAVMTPIFFLIYLISYISLNKPRVEKHA